MMSEFDPQPASTFRSAAQEEEDQAEAIKNILNEVFLDWPNEAGFQNLTEHRGPVELSVKGVIPVWAAGSLFRNGPGARRIRCGKSSQDRGNSGTLLISHWFDGLAHLHRFDIVVPDDSAGQTVQVFYSSRRQAEEFVNSAQEKGSFGDTVTFGQRADPCVGIFGKAMSCFRALGPRKEASKCDNLNVAVFPAPNTPELVSPGSRNGETDGSKLTERPPGIDFTSRRHQADKKLWITSDTSGLRTIDATTLEPLDDNGIHQQSALNALLKGPLSCAHIQRCPKTGDIFNCNIQPGRSAKYRIFKVSAATGKTDILATISRFDLPAAYIHSFFLSERFVVLRVPTAHFGKMGLSIPWKGNVIEAIEPFDESKKCKWFFVDRRHGQGVVAEFETPAGFFFHSVNAWDKIVPEQRKIGTNEPRVADVFCDVVEFPNTDIMHKFYYDVLLNIDGQAKTAYPSEEHIRKTICSLVRWKFRVPLPTDSTASTSSSTKSKKSTRTVLKPEKLFNILGPHSGELPTINPNYHTRQHRYVYGLPQTGKSTFFTTIVKTDTLTQEAQQWNNAEGHTPGEAVFVPRPGATEEDDGVLLSIVLNGISEMSYLVCIDAKSMREIGRAEMDFAVGFDLHGVHCPK
ncbi:unnamed protein product [Discula destructiva]